jgi:hypothetical protein
MSKRLYAAAGLVSVAMAAVLAVLLMSFGGHHPPPPPLLDSPRVQLPGTLVYVDEDGCIITVAASGADLWPLSCPGAWTVEEVTWVDAEHVAYRRYDSDEGDWIGIDLATGFESVLGPAVYADRATSPLSHRGERVVVDQSGDIYVEQGAATRRIFEFNGSAADGLPRFVMWSPDGEWAVLDHWRGNAYWFIKRDGTAARSLEHPSANGVSSTLSWIIPGSGIAPTREIVFD